LVAVFILSTVL